MRPIRTNGDSAIDFCLVGDRGPANVFGKNAHIGAKSSKARGNEKEP